MREEFESLTAWQCCDKPTAWFEMEGMNTPGCSATHSHSNLIGNTNACSYEISEGFCLLHGTSQYLSYNTLDL